MSPVSQPSEPERGFGHSSHLRTVTSAIVALTAILAAMGAYYVWKRSVPPIFSEGDVLIVLGDFENRTGDPLLDDSLELAFRVGMEQSKEYDILPEWQIRAALEGLERGAALPPIHRDLGIEICRQVGARAFVGGSIERVGSSYSLKASVVDPETREDLLTVARVSQTQNEILTALQQLVREVRNRLG